MIIGKVKGGLANQMFQYAFYKTIAKINNTSLYLDVSWFEENITPQWNINSKKIKPATFQLYLFNTNYMISSDKIVSKIYAKRNPYGEFKIIKKIYNQIEKIKPNHKKIIVKQNISEYDSNLMKIQNNTLLDGFFQHHQFLGKFRSLLLSEFKLKKEFINPTFLNFKKEIITTNSVSIHIRRGDYLKLNHSCSENYFNHAIRFIEKSCGNPIFYVFSDDINWCKKKLTFNSTSNFLSENYNLKDYHEIMLMKYCKHNIISNSTFSFWGAWLNENPNKKVVYPSKIKDTLNKDICIKSWNEITDETFPI
tara:strand:+ start:327 stop:1250 length:924 start_codon:yes stop_codon:yes gene_type:complete